MMPLLIGYSGGGNARAAHAARARRRVHEPDCRRRTPQTGERAATRHDRRSARPASCDRCSDLKVPYACALATGKLPRLLLGQWTMLDEAAQRARHRRRLHRVHARVGRDRRHVSGIGSRTRRPERRTCATSTLPATYFHIGPAAHRAPRRECGHARVDRRLSPRRAGATATGRRRHDEPAARGRHLAQRRPDTGASPRSARAAEMLRSMTRPAQPVPGDDAALAGALPVQRRAHRPRRSAARRCAPRARHRRACSPRAGSPASSLDAARRRYDYEGGTPRTELEVIDGRCRSATRRSGRRSSAASTSRSRRRAGSIRSGSSRSMPARRATSASPTTTSSPAAIRSSTCSPKSSFATRVRPSRIRHRSLYPPTFTPLFVRHAGCGARGAWRRSPTRSGSAASLAAAALPLRRRPTQRLRRRAARRARRGCSQSRRRRMGRHSRRSHARVAHARGRARRGERARRAKAAPDRRRVDRQPPARYSERPFAIRSASS